MTPGVIMRQTQATLRHRGFDVENFEVDLLELAEVIIGNGDIVDAAGTRGRMVVVYNLREDRATVMSFSHDLNYVFTPEPDEPPARLRGSSEAEAFAGLEEMRHPVTEAAVAIDDPEGFWHQGDDLDAQGIADLNERILNGHGRIVGKGPSRWLITFGRGHVFLVEPVTKCNECGQTLWVDEVGPFSARSHAGCYVDDFYDEA